MHLSHETQGYKTPDRTYTYIVQFCSCAEKLL